MALYLIGDIQGCNEALLRLLGEIDFSPSRDTLYLLGDLVNRGPDSLGVLRALVGCGASARCLLGNHDLNLLAVAAGLRKPHRNDTLDGILHAPDRKDLMAWLRRQPLAMHEHGCLMVHAGILPSWSAGQTMSLAGEVQSALSDDSYEDFLHHMYGDEPARWSDTLTGAERLRVVVNALTRMRFCTPDGTMEFKAKEGLDAAPPGFWPWFEVPGRQTADTLVAFGHWSTLGYTNRPNLISLDTGCVWGGCLSALRLGANGAQRELIQVKCDQSQAPG